MNIRLGLIGGACASLFATATLPAQVPQIINYQGRIVVGSTNFNGTGQFRFALVNANGSTTFWSNDNTSSAGSEPTNAVSLAVGNGLYSVLLGDTSLTNMTAVPASVFNNSDVRLRVWFNDGTHGSQLLTPDQRIASVGYAVVSTTAGNVTGVVAIANGGTGSTTQNFVDLSNGQTVGGAKTFSGTLTASGGTLALANPTANVVSFATVGVAPPSLSSTGWKIKTWGNEFGIGIDNSTQWYAAGLYHRWYNTTNQGISWTQTMSLDDTGALRLSKGTNCGISVADRDTTVAAEWVWYALSGKTRLWNNTGGDQMSLDTPGNMRVKGTVTAGVAPDIAETIPAADDVEPGDVVCADPNQKERVIRCGKNDRGLVGVIADGSSSFMINSHGGSVDAPLTGKPLVLAGRVPVKVSLENGPIRIGDYLAPSSEPGVAMRATEAGPTVGIALEAFNGKAETKKPAAVLCFVKVGEGNLGAAVAQMRAENDRLHLENVALKTRLDRLEGTVVNLQTSASIKRTARAR